MPVADRPWQLSAGPQGARRPPLSRETGVGVEGVSLPMGAALGLGSQDLGRDTVVSAVGWRRPSSATAGPAQRPGGAALLSRCHGAHVPTE